MCDVKAEIRKKGGELVVIGNGTVAQAAAFARERNLDFPVLTDPSRRIYRAVGLRRGVRSTFNLDSVKHAVKTLKKGFRQGVTQGDPWQQGGAFVIAPGDRVLFSYLSSAGGDHPAPRDLVAALPA